MLDVAKILNNIGNIDVERQAPFKDVDIGVPSVRVEYRLEPERMQIHFFSKHPQNLYPPDFPTTVVRWINKLSDDSIIDYVGSLKLENTSADINSWYVEAKYPNLRWPEEYIERKFLELGRLLNEPKKE